MDSAWDDREAAEYVARYAPRWGEALALRVYSSRLIGRDATLVLHGGGNTSVKDAVRDLFGEERAAIFVKGSGWDLAAIEPEGLPALDLAPLRRLRELAALNDEEMVNQIRARLFQSSAPNPSVETLLHAFLPHKFVDHSHADAILALSNQEQGQRIVAEALGERVVTLPFIMPGFPLAKAVAAAWEARPDCEGVLLHHHGLFTFGATARESYERHVAIVDAAERHLARSGTRRQVGLRKEEAQARERAGRIAPLLRGAVTRAAAGPSLTLEWRAGAPLLDRLGAAGARALYDTPVLTPDHALRVKPLPCWVDLDWSTGADAHLRAVEDAVQRFRDAYAGYYQRGVAARGARRPLDPAPRVLLVPGCGLFGAGTDAQAAAIAADIAEHTVATKAAAAALGPYRGLAELDLFDMEYWSLEQAKLGKASARELAGQVAVITGGGGAIGEGVAWVLAEAGAAVALLDRDGGQAEQAARRIAAKLGSRSVLALQADVTDEAGMREACAEVCRRYGGIDVLVPNAGVAHVAPLLEEDAATYRRLVEVNQVGVFLTLREGARVLRSQGLGGAIVIISSKNVLSPGADFGAYSSSKAGAHQLGRVAALELAPAGIHVNMVCPDAVFRCGDNPSGLWSEVGPERARSRGLDPQQLEDFYVQRNLLKRRIDARDVGRAVLFFAARRTPTTGALLPVDGGVAAAFPR